MKMKLLNNVFRYKMIDWVFLIFIILFPHTVSMNSQSFKRNSTSANIESKILGLTVTAPCKFSRSSQATNDYAYIGLINENDQNKAIIYKVQISEMPIPYPQMGEYDKNTIKKNIRNMVGGYSTISNLKLNTSCDFAYKYSTVESGFNMYHALIMKGKYLYEFIIFSKLNISSEVNRFYSSIR